MSIKLDQTYVSVRQRSILETYDLAIQIAKDHFLPILITLMIGCIPWMVIDYLILYRWQAAEQPAWFFFLTLTLISFQAPFGTALITDFLGAVMFRQRVHISHAIRNFVRSFGRLFLLHGLLRMAIPGTILIAIMDPSWDAGGLFAYYTFIVGGCMCVALLVRAMRPFATEVVLLEKPDRKNLPGQTASVTSRLSSLHSPAAGPLFGQGLLTFFFASLLFMVFHSIFSLRGYISGYSGNDFLTYPFFVPMACWLAAGFTTIARFLAYIDLRIRQEGWEVELKLRAEANKFHQR